MALTNGSYIVDFQAFKDLNNNFIPKELVIVSVETDRIVHCLIKSPRPYRDLHPELRHWSNYLTQYYHNILWDNGYITLPDALQLLRHTTEGASDIYVKGGERVGYISHILGRTVLDLDRVHCPKAVDWIPQITPRFPVCPSSFQYTKCSFKTSSQSDVNTVIDNL